MLLTDVAGGLVFGIPLSQCIENDRITRIAAGEIIDVGCLSRNSRHGSRTSFSSFVETPTVAAKTEEVRNCVISKEESPVQIRDFFMSLLFVPCKHLHAYYDYFLKF